MELVETLNEVIDNAKEFGCIGKEDSIAFDRFSQFFHWYYFPEQEQELFAPSKFIGYKNTTLDNYIGEGNGGRTQEVLKKWFRKLDEDSREYKDVSNKLIKFSEKMGKDLSKKVFNGSGGVYVYLTAESS